MAQDLRVGGFVTLQGTAKDVNGTLTDPDDIWVLVLSPSSGTSTFKYSLAEVTRVSLGVYKVDIQLDGAGRWHYAFQIPGSVRSEDEFVVNPSAFP